MKKCFAVFLILIAYVLSAKAQGDQQPVVGRKAAQRYFAEEKTVKKDSSSENVLMIHLGKFVNSQGYDWGTQPLLNDVGGAIYGVTYLYDQWHNFDVSIRADFNEYNIQGNHALKLALMPLWTFPRADSNFPLYFGFGLGGGVFFQQISNKSALSFDYQLVIGGRYFNIVPGVGAFLEFGLKNHLHILTNGQFNGTAVDGGVIFTF